MKKIISVFTAVLLLFMPLSVFAEENPSERGTMRLTTDLKTGKLSKEERNGDKSFSYLDPASYPLKSDGEFAGNLFDGSSHHGITFKTITEDSLDKMEIQLLYDSEYSYIKDQYLTVEFLTDNNSKLSYIGSADFDTYGYNKLGLGITIGKNEYSGKEFIYMRAGVSESLFDSYYADTLLFKVRNPFYTPEGSTPAQTGYGIISNESIFGDQQQSSGQFKINNSKYSFNKMLDQSSYRLDVKRPFDSQTNKDKRLNLFTKKAVYQVGQTKSFWVYNFSRNTDEQINATLLYTGTKTNVWVHNNQITLTDAQKLGKEFDQNIHPAITSNFAKESDVNGDGKINILTYDIQDGFSGYGGFIGGYFYAGDLHNISYSNKSEIFYIDTYPLMGTSAYKDVTESYTTLAHEFQHMVNYNQNVFVEGGKDMDVWLDEALAMAAEQVYTNQALTDRIDYYNQSNSIANGHSLLYWDYNGDTLANYSLSYLFGQYVKQQSTQGNAIFGEILKSYDNDYKAVENAVKKYISPGLSFGKFMTNFRAALLLKNKTGLHGFKGAEEFNSLKPRLYYGPPLALRGGGSVVKSISNREDFSIPADKGTDVTYTFVSEDQADTFPPAKPTVNPVSDLDTQIKGKAEPGSKVSAEVNNVKIGQAVTTAEGNFTIAIPKQKAGTIIKIHAVDSAGNQSEKATIKVLDKTAPGAPVVNQVRDYDKKVSGKAEAGSTVIVNAGSTKLGTALADKYGSFSVTLKSAQKAGTTLSVTAKDAAGNTSKATTVTVVDKTAPLVPTVNQVKDYDKKVTGKAEPYSKVTVKKGKTTLGYANTNKSGNFSVTLKSAQKTGTVLTVYAADKAGNVSKTIQVTVVDKTAPLKPTIHTVKDYDKKVSGKSEAGSRVKIKAGKTTLGYATADKYGNFSLKIKNSLKAGTVVYATANDKAGNYSPSAKTVVIDKTAPRAPSIQTVTSRSTKITGKSEAYSKVFVKSGSKVIGTTTASKSGSFSIKIAKQKKGKVLYAYSKDKAGNTSKATKITIK